MARRLVLAGVILLGGCQFYYHDLPSPDDLWPEIPWFDHMIKSRAVHPYQRADIPRTTVAGTVPVTGGQGDWSAEWQAQNATTANGLTNPADPAATLARGDTLFHTYCSVCHGPAGAGDGPVNVKLGGSAKSLLTDQAKGYSDGYIYSIIRYGKGNMPRYGDKVTRMGDRWAIVNYVRHLQGAAAVPPAGGPR